MVAVIISILFPLKVSYGSDGKPISIGSFSDRGRDIDGDGLYDYLEMRIDVNITAPGLYIVEAGNLIDREGRPIDVTAYSRLLLEAGEHVITILMDGRRIRSSGLNPSKVSYLGVISGDYSEADFLSNVSLSREYGFEEFEPPPEYSLGVAEGSWMLYRVLLVRSPDGEAEPGNLPREIMVRVSGVKGGLISLEMVFNFEGGATSSEVLEGYLERESQIFPFIIPSNLTSGDPFGLSPSSRLGEGGLEEVLGKKREVNRFRGENTFIQGNVEVRYVEDYVWDRATGILLRSWINMTLTDMLTGETGYSNVSFTILKTNLIPQRTSIRLEAPQSVELGKPLNITATLTNSFKEGMEGEEIILKSMNEDAEIGKAKTDSRGEIRLDYTPKAAGRLLIKAVYKGSEEYEASEEAIEIEVKSPFTLLTPALIAIGIASSIIILFIYLKRRTPIPAGKR
ncbi:MAG: hypothetical protein QXD04_03490 [Candidatus Bathyarchaeia archaeon]